MNKALEQKKEEIIKKAGERINYYQAGIDKGEKMIAEILNGEELKTIGENGMPKFHPEHKKINKIDFEISKIKSQLHQVENEIKMIKSGEADHMINASIQ